MITFSGLCFSVVFGYFFAERRPAPTYVRTQMQSRNIGDYLVPAASNTATPETSKISPPPLSSITITSLRDKDKEPQSQPQGLAPPIRTARSSSLAPAEPTTAVAEWTPKPTDFGQLRMPIRDVLMTVSPDGGKALRTSNTPQQASYLLLSVSGALDLWSDDRIVQKYALTVLYYSTKGKNWKDGVDNWNDLAQNDCFKIHVECNPTTDKIISIELPSNNLQGSLPPELALLTDLERLNLSRNDLTGVLPTEVGLLKELKVLELEDNPKLKGVIPKEIIDLNLDTIKIDLPPPS
jgi:hypothetical protein